MKELGSIFESTGSYKSCPYGLTSAVSRTSIIVLTTTLSLMNFKEKKNSRIFAGLTQCIRMPFPLANI